MALTYKDQATLAADVGWAGRVVAATADVAQTQLRVLVPTAPNYTQLIRLAVDALTSPDLQSKIRSLVAASLPATVVLATPTADTGTDVQLRAQVRNAFDNLVVY